MKFFKEENSISDEALRFASAHPTVVIASASEAT